MKKRITLFVMVLSVVYFGYGQSVNLTDALISPAPLPSVQANGTGIAEFRLQETSGSPVTSPVFGTLPNVTITVDLGDYIDLTNGTASLGDITITDVSSGTDLSALFIKNYNGTNRILKFEQTNNSIPADANIKFTFPIKVIQNSSESEVNNGFNANVAALGSTTNAEGNAAFFTWTENTTVAINDINNTYEGVAVSGNVLINDYDIEGDIQTVNTTPISNVSNGVLVLNSNGTYTYTPNAGYIGQDSFTYQVCDNIKPAACDQGVVFLEVISNGTLANEAPIANADTATTEEGITLTGNVLSNDYDPDGDLLTINTTPISNVSNGTLTINADGTFTYVPNSGFTGTDSFTYEVCDNAPTPLCDTAVVEIKVNSNMGNITVANDDAFTTISGTTLTSGNILENDFDPEGNTQNVNTTPVTNVSNGTLTLNTNGTFTYVPNSGFTGTDSFVYQVCDNGVPQACDEGTVVITVGGIPNTTVAINDIANTNQGITLTGNVLTNDYDPEGDVQTVNTTPISNVSNGTLTINADGSYTYVPDAAFTGQDSFIYEVCDNGTPKACDQAEVFIEVLPDTTSSNNPPVANSDTATTEEGVNLTGNVVNNDYDPDGDPLTVNTTPVSNVSNGTLTLNADGTFTYVPNAGFVGVDSFSYQVCDNGTPTALCDTAVVEIKIISNVGNITVANDDAFDTIADTANNNVVGNVLINDSDPEGHLQTINTTPVTNVSNGNLTINADGTFNYQPNAGFVGQDSFVYQVCDNGTPQACDQATVIILVKKFMAPDYTVSVITSETNIVGEEGEIDFVVFIGEGKGFDANGINEVEFRISDSENFKFTYESNLTSLNGLEVYNSNWTYKLEGGLHKFVYIGNGGIFKGNSFSRLGVKAKFISPKNSSGDRPLKATIKSNSGGQVFIGNDNDSDKISYSNN